MVNIHQDVCMYITVWSTSLCDSQINKDSLPRKRPDSIRFTDSQYITIVSIDWLQTALGLFNLSNQKHDRTNLSSLKLVLPHQGLAWCCLFLLCCTLFWVRPVHYCMSVSNSLWLLHPQQRERDRERERKGKSRFKVFRSQIHCIGLLV